MKTVLVICAIALSFCLFGADELKHGPDSEYHDGVPKGKVEQQPKWKSKIFPGTERDWWIYVPAQYDAAKPANIMVFQDGGGPKDPKGEMRVPVVFDNLIQKGEMPVTLGIFIPPGTLPPADNTEVAKSESRIKEEIAALVAKGKTREEAEKSVSKTAPRQARQNRAFEYDSVGDRYARFLIEEILPEVAKKYSITSDPAGRAICGTSSGGSCAFTAAWERPDAFGKVVSGIGSFTSLHGCNAYPDLIRKMEPKPIRIYMQDGDHDLDIYAGSWWHANNDMAAAFRWMGYDYFFLQGVGGHSGRQLGVNFPDVMRWLWRKDPVEGKRPAGADPRGVAEVLIKDEGWKKVAEIAGSDSAAAADEAGNVFFSSEGAEGQRTTIKKLGNDGKISEFATSEKPAIDLQFGPDGKLYAGFINAIRTYAKDGKEAVFADKFQGECHAFAINHKGDVYGGISDPEQLLVQNAKGQRSMKDISEVVPSMKDFNPSYFIFTPDQGFLSIIEFDKMRIQSVRVEADGSLSQAEPFYTLQSLEGQDEFFAYAAAVDDKGRLYVSTSLGIQIFDQGGRVIGILTLPERNQVKGMCFGGPNFGTLYAVTEKAVFARKLNATGVRACNPPVTVKPPQM